MTSITRVSIVTSYPMWLKNGYAVNTLRTIEAVQTQDVSVHVVAFIPWGSRLEQGRLEWREIMGASGVEVTEVVGLPDAGVTLFRWIADAWAGYLIRRALQAHGYDVVHARGVRAAYLCAMHRAERLLVDIRGDMEAEARLGLASGLRGFSRARVRWATRETNIALGAAASFVVVSEAMDGWLRARCDVGERVTRVIPCALKVSMFQQRSVEQLTEPGCETALVVCYVGGLQIYQPLELIAQAFRKLALTGVPIRFLVATRDSTLRMRAEMTDLNVHYVSLEPDEVPGILSGCDVGIVPRNPDPTNAVACPTKIGEYLAAGLAVLVSQGVGGWAASLQRDGVGGSLDLPISELGDLLRAIRHNRGEVAQRSHAIALRDWSWGSAIERLMEAYSAAAVSCSMPPLPREQSR